MNLPTTIHVIFDTLSYNILHNASCVHAIGATFSTLHHKIKIMYNNTHYIFELDTNKLNLLQENDRYQPPLLNYLNNLVPYLTKVDPLLSSTNNSCDQNRALILNVLFADD